MPIWLQIISAVITLLLAILTTIFIWRQVRLEKTKLKLEAYDRRLKIYNAIKIFIAETQTYGTTNDEKLVKLLQETRESLFLVKENNISEYIETLHNKGVDLEFVKTKLSQSGIYLEDKEREKLAKQAEEIIQWMADQHKVVEEKFSKYLSIN